MTHQTKQQTNYNAIPQIIDDEDTEIECMVDEIVSDLFHNDNNSDDNLLLPPLPQTLVNDVSAYSDDTVSSLNSQQQQAKSEYHLIYLKPIIERMQLMTQQSIDSEYIIDVVDAAIKHGKKRQISKRTYEFKYMGYTVIMSKSLKTILDVSLSNNPQIITVHPDVVSIISKKCPVLSYFNILKVAQWAKNNGSFLTKKNDYRQQFIYNFCGCRIVFASNHCTIVEMQCNDYSMMKNQLSL